jgi:putative ABC transport system ATP-binding protein
MISIRNLSKTFHAGQADEVKALKNLTLDIQAGEFVIIIGSNGSGKSTLFNLLFGSLFPDTGSISIAGNDLTALPDYRRSRWISMVFQNPGNGTAPNLSLLENFRLAALRTSKKRMITGIDAAFRRQVAEKVKELGMGLEKKLDTPMGSLSGGQRQALTLLMAVMDKPGILLMDEPTAALDPKSAEMIMELAADINRRMGVSILLVTHSMKQALQYGNRLLLFREGNLVKDLNREEKQKLEPAELYGWFS